MARLVLLRHGESQWNLENRFTGWVDVPLSPRGIQEAKNAGDKLRGFAFDRAFTSVLVRAIERKAPECLSRILGLLYTSR